MNISQKILVIIIATFIFAGCFAAQRNSVNEEADNKLRALDVQCKSNMTDWCMLQYQQVEAWRARELNDISNRQALTVQSINNANANFQNNLNNNRQINCTSQTIGNQTYTNCR